MSKKFECEVYSIHDKGLHCEFGQSFTFDYLPRIGDLIGLEGFYYRAKDVAINQQSQYEPTLIVTAVGDWSKIETGNY
ncbi:hypothetical protein J8L98_22125 [Pseudoalteromonas sp. MMG013]|uniref:hypothetical protein n=1 Tax=Pseudoalteromonas sp. MMG013 TaxID=2822687 RepID=UPI001B377CEA|nr:hypothetical protein [Pseudoalteromonas sp. MMG013]MBQ4864393.1 hypothetical protein [Pseudoalteromonas sp. MMG013]